MIIGHGDIAKVLQNCEDTIFFASGVSNSQEKRPSEFEREQELLLEYLPIARTLDMKLVYFSTLSVFYKDSHYTRHKLRMEQLVKTFPRYTIIRLGNISWGTNPHTLINHLKANPDAEIRDVYRYVIEQDEFLHWINMIPEWNCEMNCPGRRLKVSEIKQFYVDTRLHPQEVQLTK